MWLTIDERHISFQSRNLSIFASVSFNYAQRATLKNCRKKESDLYNKRHEAECGSASLCFLQFTVWRTARTGRAGLVPGLAGDPWHLGMSWTVNPPILTASLLQSISINTFLMADNSDCPFPCLWQKIWKKCFLTKTQTHREFTLRCLNLWGWTWCVHIPCSRSVWISLLEGLKPQITHT